MESQLKATTWVGSASCPNPTDSEGMKRPRVYNLRSSKLTTDTTHRREDTLPPPALTSRGEKEMEVRTSIRSRRRALRSMPGTNPATQVTQTPSCVSEQHLSADAVTLTAQTRSDKEPNVSTSRRCSKCSHSFHAQGYSQHVTHCRGTYKPRE